MSVGVSEKKVCEDCGGDTIPHGFTYASILLDEILSGIFPIGRKGWLSKTTGAFEDWIAVPFLDAFVGVGLAKKQLRPDDGTLLLARCLWEEADARGIEIYEWRLFGLPRNIMIARFPQDVSRKGPDRRIAFEGIPAAPYERDRAAWMDDKARLKEEFQKEALPVARGGAARNARQALDIYRSLAAPVIVKPRAGSGSRHTVLHITDESELLRAFAVAKQVSPVVVIEEELVGPVYRATVVDGKFVAALRRDPPHVVGDGKHSLVELVEEANKHPARSGPYFSKIQLNENAAKELRWQEYDLGSVPPKGKRVYFHQKVNWALGGTTADVTDDVHPDNRALFEKAARILHAPITGIDFITKDIDVSWKEQNRCGILECNSMPFFDNHHLPFEGQPRNVAGAIWDMVSPPGA